MRRRGKLTTRRREGVGVVVEKNERRRTFNKNSCDLLTAITHTEILVARCIFLIKSESASDSVGVLEDKSSSSRILEDNFEVLSLGLGLGLEACVLDSITGK